VYLIFLLLNGDFEYQLVYETTNIYMPAHQKLSALWANQNSSLNFWSFLMTCAVMTCTKISKGYQNEKTRIITIAIFLFTVIVFFAPVVFVLNPFTKLWVSKIGLVQSSVIIPEDGLPLFPGDGVGLNPSLRHPAMMFHPLFLYLGLIGFFIPYVQAMASLILRDKEFKWILYNQQISLYAWVCLTIGMLLGSWWAYSILGWGGYWGWDAVEIAGLIPWLISIAYLHALFSTNRKTSSNFWVHFALSLIIIFTFIGIFVTRSGVIESVHAYARGPIGPILSLLVIIFAFFSFYLIISRKKILCGRTKKFPNSIIITLSHFLLLLLSLFYLWGQTLPITSSLISGERQLLPIETYQLVSTPIILTILWLEIFHFMKKVPGRITHFSILLMIPPVLIALFFAAQFNLRHDLTIIQWIFFFTNIFLVCILLIGIGSRMLHFVKHKITLPVNEHVPGQRTCSNLFIHLGFSIMLVGILGVEYGATHAEAQLAVGESRQVGDYQFTMNSTQSFLQTENRIFYESSFILEKRNSIIGSLAPQMIVYENFNMINAQPAIHSNILEDVQIIMRTWKDSEHNKTLIDILFYPLAVWIWIGGGMMCLGGIMELIKGKSRFQ
jgi:cytochrome c-type biogenesis protein CcmF